MSRLIASLVLTLGTAYVSAQATQAVQDTGQFEYRVLPVDIVWENMNLVARLGFEVKNKGAAPVQIALLTGLGSLPTLQTEGGVEFRLGTQMAAGISTCREEPSYCEKNAAAWTVLRPGRTLTGSMTMSSTVWTFDKRVLVPAKWGRFSAMFVARDSENGKTWTEPFTIADVKVIANVR
jgi:hypothetical protein